MAFRLSFLLSVIVALSGCQVLRGNSYHPNGNSSEDLQSAFSYCNSHVFDLFGMGDGLGKCMSAHGWDRD